MGSVSFIYIYIYIYMEEGATLLVGIRSRDAVFIRTVERRCRPTTRN